jgi:tetratricopeptide (TPR) repeat protein
LKTALIILVAAFSYVGSSVAATGDGFYEQQLQAGKVDFQAHRISQAANELRIAAFGFLDRPQLLAEALIRLVVAQNALGLDADASKTLERFVEVEQRFAPYKSLGIEPQVKTAFENFALKSLSNDTVLSLPAFRRISVDAQLRRIAALPERKRIGAYRELAEHEPKNPEWPLALALEYSSRDASRDTIQWGTRVLELDPGNLDARALVVHARTSSHACRDALPMFTETLLKERRDTYADQAVCLAETGRWTEAKNALANVPEQLKRRTDVRRAEKLVADNVRTVTPTSAVPKPPTPTQAAAPKAAEALEIARKLNHDGKFDESLRRLSAAVAADPGNRSLRLAMLEAAVLAKAFQTAAAQISFVSPLSPGEELYMFYASVALYETGRKAEAKPLMERARPHMVPNPMVNYYVQMVLG